MVDGIVAEASAFERLVNLGRDEIAVGRRSAAAAIHGCFLAAANQVQNIANQSFVEKYI
jgi:hypothetical protein